MNEAALAAGLCMAIFGPPIGALYIPQLAGRIASRIPRHPKTPAAMLAAAMIHPATTGDWRKENRCYINDKMGISIRQRMFSTELDPDFPVSWADGKRLQRAARFIDKRLARERLAAEIERISEQFERAYATNR